LWEIHIVNKLNNIDETECANVPSGSFALITKIHHVAIDGTSAMRFFQALSDIDPTGTPATDIDNIQGVHDDEPTVGKMLYNAIHNHIRSPLQFMNTAARSIPSIAPSVMRSLINRDKSERNTVVHSRFNDAVAPQKSFSACSFQLGDLKSLQALAPESKLNDVVLAICSGALHHYLLAHQDLPATPLIAWVPINARTPKADSSASDGNEITAMSANLYTHIGDPIARFKAITAATRLSKEAKSGVSARLMTDLSKHMPGATMALASKLILASNVTAKLCNLAVSNVPGPQIPLYIKGAQCLHQYGMVPLADAMGLFVVTLSYNGKMSFSVTSSDNIIPDLPFFTECLTLAFNELKDLTNTLSANADRSN
jgi:WS/DGAT/MGAT family acyltransferase